jgi:hypothetical protein
MPMTNRPVFTHDRPLPGWEAAPVITAEQMSRFLYQSVGFDNARKIAKLINGDTCRHWQPGKRQLMLASRPTPAPAKPALPPEYVPTDEDRSGWGPGDVVVCRSKYLPGKGKTTALYGEVGREYVIAGRFHSDLRFTDGGHGDPRRFDLVRKAAPKYKVRDGEVTEGDTVYWLAKDGPDKITIGAPGTGWDGNEHNLKSAPWCYQKAEPRIITEFGRRPKARFAYLDTDYDIKRECSGAL